MVLKEKAGVLVTSLFFFEALKIFSEIIKLKEKAKPAGWN